jgi:hypothetical protein
MPDTIALICAGCGATVQRHPAMRLRRVVCYECVKARKRETKARRASVSRSSLIEAAVKPKANRSQQSQ